MLKKLNFNLIFAWIGLGLILVLTVFSYTSTEKYRAINAWRIHSEEVITLAHKIQMSVERAETAQRGYLMTLHQPFLETHLQTIETINTDIQVLGSLLKDNAFQTALFEKIKNQIQGRTGHLIENIKMAEQGKSKEVFEQVKSGEGRQLMLELRETFAQFVREETELLNQRTFQADSEFEKARSIVVGGLGGAFGLLLIVILLLRAEAKRRQVAEKKANEASDLKSQFLANMSHEIRTPLNGIIGMAKIMGDTPLNAEQQDFLATIRDSSNTLLTLINQILDLSKIESGKLQLEETHFELRSLIGSTISVLDYAAKAKGLILKTAIDADVEDMYIGDPLRLRQVLINLINNAIKFTESGAVELKVHRGTAVDSEVWLKFEVADSGIGMNRDTLKRLFQSFSQGDESTSRRYGGTGLGLAITKQLVQMMGGDIVVESEEGLGSRFKFNVKFKIAKYAIAHVADEAATIAADGAMVAHILVAEDNLINQKVVGAMLSKMGFTYDVASTGVEALKALKNKNYDLILMDGQMPEMDGYETTKRIRIGEAGENNRKAPIIAVTANAIKGDLERCLEAGMDDYVSKPISLDDLKAKVHKRLKSSSRSLDMQVLNALRQLETDANRGLVKEVVALFVSSTPDYLDRMRVHIKDGKFKDLHVVAHGLKSACGTVGAVRMRSIAARLERMNNIDDLPTMNKLMTALEEEYSLVKEELRKSVGLK